MEAEELDQIVSAVAETVNTQFGARLDALEKHLSDSAVAEPPSAESTATEEPPASEDSPVSETTDAEATETTKEPAAQESDANEPATDEATNDLAAAGTPEEVAEFRAYQASKAKEARQAEIKDAVTEAFAARGHTITPASPSKPAGAGASEDADDPRAAYAKEFEAKTKIPFDLAFATASQRSRMLSAPEALMVNAHLRNHGKPPVAA
ncbi:hypothetical protein N9260_01350 [bacterium]|nr:hypothetical protein [bacterium]